MDGSAFDTLTRRLSLAGSRRRALGGLLAGALGMLSRTEAEEATAHDLKATCKKKSGETKKTCLKKARKHNATHTLPPPTGGCPTGQKPCAGSCIPSNQCCTDGDCPAATPRCCGGACLDVRTDVRNCGSCGTRCMANEQCVAGRCHCGFNVCSSEPNFRNGSCCAGNCKCTFEFQNLNTCGSVTECPSGTTPCIAPTDNCAGLAPAKACCPTGTTCTAEGTCRID